MRVLVTGAFGYLGGRLADSLRVAGHVVSLSGRFVPEYAAGWAGTYPVQIADVLDALAVEHVVQDVDGVVHLAALDEVEAAKRPVLAVRVAAEGVANVARAARAIGARVIHFSTVHIEKGPGHPYAAAHLAGEAASLAAGGETAIARLSNAYGCPKFRQVRRWTLAHNDFCQQAVERGKIVLVSDGMSQRDFVWVEDVSRAIDLLLRAPAQLLGEPFVVGSGVSRSILAVAETVRVRAQARLGRNVSIERPEPGPSQPAVAYSIERLKALGYAPRDAFDEETDRILTLLGAPP